MDKIAKAAPEAPPISTAPHLTQFTVTSPLTNLFVLAVNQKPSYTSGRGLPQTQKTKPRSIQFLIARPPEALSLPLNPRNVGMSRWQLLEKITLAPSICVGPMSLIGNLGGPMDGQSTLLRA